MSKSINRFLTECNHQISRIDAFRKSGVYTLLGNLVIRITNSLGKILFYKCNILRSESKRFQIELIMKIIINDGLFLVHKFFNNCAKRTI